MQSKANKLQRLIKTFDNYQRRNHNAGFIYAVIKKYGEDNGGYQSAIITYYALLSLFPLLYVFTFLTQLTLRSNPALRLKFSDAVDRYFPLIGNQLQHSISSPHKTGLALAVSILVTFYGARGIASATQFSIGSLWFISPAKQPPFLKNVARSFGIILTGGLGFVIAALLSGYTEILGRSFGVKILSAIISFFVLWGMFILLFKLAIAGNKRVKKVIVGAGVAAAGMQVLQTIGGVLLAHELKSLNTTSGTFALVIALLFWIYIQVQIMLYSVEIDVVRNYHLFPRSIQSPLTDADKETYTAYDQASKHLQNEQVSVRFHVQ